jgi:glycosyltransferase involved in cell wall biosynthesis
MTPSVSVVIATYNYGRFLRGALESALNQTHRDLEVIVVDDGSTDDTPTVIEPYLADPRVRYHRTDHLGQPGAKNAGIRLCRAPLIAFLDADDLWLPEKIQKQVALFRANPRVGVVHAQRHLIDEAGRPLEYTQPECHRGLILAEMYRTNFICFSSVVVRRAVFDAVGLFDERLQLAIDYDLWLRAAKRFEFDHIAEPLVKYRVGHANLSKRVGERLSTVRKIRKRFLREHSGRLLVPGRVRRRAHAEVYCQLSLASMPHSRWKAVMWLLKALAHCPAHGPAWHGLLSVPMPESWRRVLRRLLGRPEQWNLHRRLPTREAA